MRVESGEIIEALRCSATPIPKGTDCLKHCKGCPYDYTEKPGKFEMFLAEKDGLLHGCDVDRMAMDAAERIEELEKRVLTLVRAMQFKPLLGELCGNCKYEERQPGEAPCENCKGLNFEWKEGRSGEG